MALNTVCIFMFLLIITISQGDPLSYTKCSLADSSCLTVQAAEVLPAFVQGIPDLGIKRLDEIYVESKKVDFDGLKYELSNVVMTGLKDAKVNRLSVNMDLKMIRLTFQTSLKVFIGKYKTEGFLYSAPMNGEGSGNITTNNVKVDFIFPFEIVKNEEGKEVLDLKSYRYGFQIIDQIIFDITFQGTDIKVTESELNEYMNDTWMISSQSHITFFYNIISDNIFEAVKTFLEKQPLQDLVIDA